MKTLSTILATIIASATLISCGAGSVGSPTVTTPHVFIAADLNPLINDQESYLREYGIYNGSLDGVLMEAVQYLNEEYNIGYAYGDFAYLSCINYLQTARYCSNFAVNATHELDKFKQDFKG